MKDVSSVIGVSHLEAGVLVYLDYGDPSSSIRCCNGLMGEEDSRVEGKSQCCASVLDGYASNSSLVGLSTWVVVMIFVSVVLLASRTRFVSRGKGSLVLPF